MKCCHTFCRWVVLLQAPLQQSMFIPLLSLIFPHLLSFPTFPTLNAPLYFLLSHPHSFIFSHLLIPSCHCFTGKSHETGGAAPVPGDAAAFGAHEGKARQWQLAHHIRGRLYMCVCVCTRVFLRVCELHTWVYNNKSPAACQPQGSSCSGPQIRGLQYTGCHYRVERWMDGCTDGSADHSPCCLILNSITINMNINYVNLKGYIASSLGSNGSPSGVGLAEYFKISASACWEFLTWTRFTNLYSFEYMIRKLRHQKGGWAGNLSLPQKDTARAKNRVRSNHFSMSWEHQKTWQSCLIRTLLPLSPSIM